MIFRHRHILFRMGIEEFQNPRDPKKTIGPTKF